MEILLKISNVNFFIISFWIIILNSYSILNSSYFELSPNAYVTWGYDEVQHFDYIDKLSDGIFPTSNESVSIFITNHLPKTDQVHYSYEAQQGPLYYMLLAIPHKLLKIITNNDNSSFYFYRNLQILRFINYIFFIIGSVISAFIVYELGINKKKDLRLSISLFVFLILLIPNLNSRRFLNCDNLSLLMVSTSYLYCLRVVKIPSSKNIGLCLFFGSLSFITKYTNGFIILLSGCIVLYSFYKSKLRYQKTLQIVIGILPSIIVLVGFVIINGYRFGFNDIFGSKNTQLLFHNIGNYDTWTSLINIISEVFYIMNTNHIYDSYKTIYIYYWFIDYFYYFFI